MKKQEFINSIADKLKVDAKLLATTLEKDDNIDFKFTKLNSFTDEELTIRDKNIKKSSYDEGVTVGFDKSAKKIKEVSGIELEGKDLTKIINAIIDRANKDAKVEPNTKLEEANKSISKLQETITELESQNETLSNNFNSYKKEQKILSEIPANSVGLSNSTVLSEMKSNGYHFTDDGVTLNGELLKDQKMQSSLSRKDVFTQFLTDKNWLKLDKKGRGGNDELGGLRPINYEQFVEQCKADNINPAGSEAQARAQELAKENPDFYN